jgi:putative ABC transport system permease protein
MNWLASAGQDFRYATRTLRRSLAFSVVAVLTLALGVASTTAIFSVLDAVLFRGLPYRSPDRLQTVYERSDDGKLRLPSYPTFMDWQAQGSAVSTAIEGFAFVRGNGVSMPSGPGETDRRIAAYVTPGFFPLLGTRPLLGRTFLPDEEKPGGPQVGVISYEFFMQRFGGDRAVIGKVVAVDSVPTTIVGVMPRAFAYPNYGGEGSWYPPAIWQPIAIFQATHTSLALRGLHVDSRALLRLRGGADSVQAVAAMRTIQLRLAAEYPAEQEHWTSIGFRSVSDEMFGQLRSTLFLIGGAIVLVLLLACANVANLFLIRASTRARELAVRSALGARRGRIARQLLTETMVLAGIAGALGAGLASVLVAFVRRFASGRLPFASDISVDGRALLFTLGASVIIALLIGALPAWQATGGRLVERLRSGAAAAIGGVAEQRVRNVLVSLQFALAVTLLVGAGLLIQSVRRLQSVPLGYDPTNVVELTIAPPSGKYDAPAQAAMLYARILDALRAIPGVELVAAAGGALLPTKVEPEGQASAGPPTLALYHPVSADYLRTMRIPVVAGRWFTEDDMRVPAGFVVNETLAKRLWPGSSALGRRVTTYRASQARADFGRPIDMPVVGVVADVHQYSRESKPEPELFLPYTLEVWPWMTFVVRVPHPSRAMPTVTAALRSVEPAIAFRGTPSVMRVGVPRERQFVTSLLGGFAAGALLLAAIGLYGIVAYGVAQRTREVGIRIALGASPRSIVRLVLGQGARSAIAGAALGMAGALAATRLLRGMLFETTTTDAPTFLAVPIVLAVVALLASYLPARRATRTDPLIAIRTE